MKILINSLFGIAFIISGNHAALACGTSIPATMSTTPATLSLGPMDSIDVTGTLIGGWSSSPKAILNSKDCPDPLPITSWAVGTDTPLSMTASSDGLIYPIYPTEIPNIGYFVQVKDPIGQAQPLSPTPSQSLWNSSSLMNWGVIIKVHFVATGPLQPGTYYLASHKVGDGWLSTDLTSNNKVVSAELSYNSSTITVTGSTCTINSGDDNINVTLPTVSVGNFSGVGSHASAHSQQSFSIGLNCQAGITLFATMSDIAAPANTSNILSLSGSSTASGLGLQLWANGASTPLSFGPESSAKGNLNQWFVGGSSSSAAAMYNIPFIVRYIQTSSKLTPGTVNAISTITFSYQ